MEIKGKIAIVTGASSGIGLAAARALTLQGAKVALVARSKDKLEEISKTLSGSLVVPADMAKQEDIENMVKAVRGHFGRVDILVNNAGRGYDAPIEKIKLDSLRQVYELDFLGPIIAMQNIIPFMREQGGGAIVNISSGTALMHLPDMGAYAAIKSALAHISLTARAELEKEGIVVSVVYPYSTDTEFEKNTLKNDVPEWDGELPHPPDSADYAAGKIIEAIQTGKPEIFAHEWMGKNQAR